MSFIEQWFESVLRSDWKAVANPNTGRWEVHPVGEFSPDAAPLGIYVEEEVARHLARAHNYYITYLAGIAWQEGQEIDAALNSDPETG